MSEWKKTTLGELVDIKHGYAFKGEFFTEIPNEYALLTPGNFHIGGGFKTDKFKYYTGDFPEEYVLSPGDVIVTMTDLSKEGDTLGYSARIPESKNHFLHNQRLGLVTTISNKADINFIYWLLRTSHYQKTIVNSCSGSTVKHTSPSRIKNYNFLLPPIAEQIAIDKGLSSLDRKIENLRRQNETLERIAQTLFKHWFVDFEFPNEYGKPYKSSSGEMVRSELGEIPTGWRVGTLGDFCSIKHGYAFKGEFITTEETDQVLLTPGNFRIGGGFNASKYKYYSDDDYDQEYILESGDLIVNMTDLSKEGDTLGYPAFVPKNAKNLFLHNQRLGKVVDSQINLFFLFFLLCRREYRSHILGTASGSTVRHTSPSRILEYKFAVPIKELLDQFYLITSSLLGKSFSHDQQIQTLTKTRDMLLPKLMSGQLRII